jgi:hypothetical protein
LRLVRCRRQHQRNDWSGRTRRHGATLLGPTLLSRCMRCTHHTKALAIKDHRLRTTERAIVLAGDAWDVTAVARRKALHRQRDTLVTWCGPLMCLPASHV